MEGEEGEGIEDGELRGCGGNKLRAFITKSVLNGSLILN